MCEYSRRYRECEVGYTGLMPVLRRENMLTPWQWTAVSSYVPYTNPKRRSLE